MKRNIRNNSREKQVHESVVQYISLQYPTIWFKSDQSGAKMEGSQALSTHSLSKQSGFPDLTLYEPRLGYTALYLELKQEGEELITSKKGPLRSKGQWRSKHIQEQVEWIQHLNSIGSLATFSIGTDHTRQIIDAYMTENLPLLESILIRTESEAARFINSPINQASWLQRQVPVHRKTGKPGKSQLRMRQQNF